MKCDPNVFVLYGPNGDVEGILAATELYGSAPLIGAGLTGALALVALLSLVGARGVDARGVAGALGTLLLLAPHAVLETLGWGDHEAALAEHHRGWNLDALEGVQLPEGPAGDVEAPVEGWLVADGSQPARELPKEGWLITAESTHEHPLVQLLSLGGLRLRSAGGATLFVVDADQVELRQKGEQPELLGVGEEAAELLAAHPQKAEMALVPGPYWSVDELVLLCQAVNAEGSCPIAEEAPENPPAPRQAARIGGGGGGAGGVVAPTKVKAVVGKYRGQVRFCYEQAGRQGHPALHHRRRRKGHLRQGHRHQGPPVPRLRRAASPDLDLPRGQRRRGRVPLRAERGMTSAALRSAS